MCLLFIGVPGDGKCHVPGRFEVTDKGFLFQQEGKEGSSFIPIETLRRVGYSRTVLIVQTTNASPIGEAFLIFRINNPRHFYEELLSSAVSEHSPSHFITFIGYFILSLPRFLK